MPPVLQSLSTFRDDYALALEWLRELGVRVDNTRLSRYLAAMDDAIAREKQGDTAHQQSADFSSTIVEASEICLIATLDPAVFRGRDDVLTKLRQIQTGPEIISDDGEDEGRNYAFEFSTAAILNERNAFGGFGAAGGDLLLRDGNHPVECKRISSLRRIEQRVRIGRNQLNAFVDAGGPRGIVALDLSRPIRLAQGPIVAANDDELSNTSAQHARAYIREHVLHERILRAALGHGVLGLLVRYVAFGIAGDAGNVRRSIVWNLCYIHSDESEESRLFLRLADPFGRGPIEHITEGEIADACARIDARIK